LSNEAGAYKQFMTDHFGIGGVFLECGYE